MRRYPPLLLAVSVLMTLSGCERPDRTIYDAAMGCLTNELAWHEFVDQNYDLNTMMPEDGRRVRILRSRAVRAGQAIGISAERTYGDTWREAEKIIRRYDDVQIAAIKRARRARSCLPQPAGSTRFALRSPDRPGTN